MALHLGDLRIQLSDPVTILPGAQKEIHKIVPFSPNSETVLVAVGVSQHPGTTYIYNSDGRPLKTPVPLGEFHRPLFTCRDLGEWLVIGEIFTVTVINNDEEAHRYASLAWTFDRTKA